MLADLDYRIGFVCILVDLRERVEWGSLNHKGRKLVLGRPGRIHAERPGNLWPGIRLGGYGMIPLYADGSM